MKLEFKLRGEDHLKASMNTLPFSYRNGKHLSVTSKERRSQCQRVCSINKSSQSTATTWSLPWVQLAMFTMDNLESYLERSQRAATISLRSTECKMSRTQDGKSGVQGSSFCSTWSQTRGWGQPFYFSTLTKRLAKLLTAGRIQRFGHREELFALTRSQ